MPKKKDTVIEIAHRLVREYFQEIIHNLEKGEELTSMVIKIPYKGKYEDGSSSYISICMTLSAYNQLLDNKLFTEATTDYIKQLAKLKHEAQS